MPIQSSPSFNHKSRREAQQTADSNNATYVSSSALFRCCGTNLRRHFQNQNGQIGLGNTQITNQTDHIRLRSNRSLIAIKHTNHRIGFCQTKARHTKVRLVKDKKALMAMQSETSHKRCFHEAHKRNSNQRHWTIRDATTERSRTYQRSPLPSSRLVALESIVSSGNSSLTIRPIPDHFACPHQHIIALAATVICRVDDDHILAQLVLSHGASNLQIDPGPGCRGG